MKEHGAIVRMLRADTRLPQKILAHHMALSQGEYSKIEREVKPPTVRALTRLAETNNTTVNRLLLGHLLLDAHLTAAGDDPADQLLLDIAANLGWSGGKTGDIAARRMIYGEDEPILLTSPLARSA